MRGPSIEDVRKRASDSDDTRAKTELAVALHLAFGTDRNPSESLKLFEEAANAGDAVAKSWLGEMRLKTGQKFEAESLWLQSIEGVRKRAEEGDAIAQHQLGNCYYYGRNVRSDKHQMFLNYQKAAKQGYGPAMFDFAWCFEQGCGVVADLEHAFALFTTAAIRGCLRSMEKLKKKQDHLLVEGIQELKQRIAYLERLETRFADLEARLEHSEEANVALRELLNRK